MKNILTPIVLTLAFFSTLFVSCTKTPPMVPPANPGQGGGQQAQAGLHVTFELPAGATIQPDSALLSLSKNGQMQQAKVKISLQSGRLGTGLIQLPAGNYELAYLTLTRNGEVVYALPRAQSARASQVSLQLPLQVTSASQAEILNLQVASVSRTDQPAQFGYPADAFNQQALIGVSVTAAITVGNHRYTNLDAPLELEWFDARGQMNTRHFQLGAGQNAIGLPVDGVRYVLRMRKWDQVFEKTIQASEVRSGMNIVLEGEMAPRKLLEEYTEHEVEGVYRPYSRKTYEYDAQGRLVKTSYFQKTPQRQDLVLQQVETMEYNLNKLASIRYYDGKNASTGYLHFRYDANGRVIAMEQQQHDRTTYAAVAYRNVDAGQEVTIDYLFDNGQAMEYKFVMRDGNKVSEGALSSTGGTEGGSFSYDKNINPFAQLNYQDIYLRHLSKNNLTGEQKSYGANIPSNVPYKFEYQYDSKGYPVQLVKGFKGYTTGTHLFNAKTTYTYN